MSLSASSLISLALFSGFAVAGIFAPDCSSTYGWSFNSVGQNPCTVAAYMLSTCHSGSFTVQSLPPGGYHYSGPTKTQGGDLCMCNTIAYSLLSACDGCQGSDWITWSDFSKNCTTILPPGTFPNPIPRGTSLQRWAVLDVTTGDNWNPNTSRTVGDTPELLPGTVLSPSGASGSVSSTAVFVFPSTPAASSSSSSSPSSTSGSTDSVPARTISSHSSHTGAIAGGVVGGVGGISILLAALLFCLRKRRRQGPGAQSTSDGQPGGFNPLTDQAPRSPVQETITSSVPDTSTYGMRQSNPEDLNTYRQYQGVSPPPTYHPIMSPSPTSSRNLYTRATPPTSQGQGALPMS